MFMLANTCYCQQFATDGQKYCNLGLIRQKLVLYLTSQEQYEGRFTDADTETDLGLTAKDARNW